MEMERLTEIKTHVTGFSYTDKKEGIFAQNVYAKLAAYEDTGLTPEQIEAQQQEIDRLKSRLSLLESFGVQYEGIEYHNPADTTEINRLKVENECQKDLINQLESDNINSEMNLSALTADKDEQAGRIMALENGLWKAKRTLQWLNEMGGQGYRVRDKVNDRIKAIDALLGGAEEMRGLNETERAEHRKALQKMSRPAGIGLGGAEE
jgi:hypothetical protein